MCVNSEKTRTYRPTSYCGFRFQRLQKRNSIRVIGLVRMRKVDKEAERKRSEVKMEMKNLKLYLENKSIIEDNQKLKKKALLLRQENQALLSQLQHMLSRQQND